MTFRSIALAALALAPAAFASAPAPDLIDLVRAPDGDRLVVRIDPSRPAPKVRDIRGELAGQGLEFSDAEIGRLLSSPERTTSGCETATGPGCHRISVPLPQPLPHEIDDEDHGVHHHGDGHDHDHDHGVITKAYAVADQGMYDAVRNESGGDGCYWGAGGYTCPDPTPAPGPAVPPPAVPPPGVNQGGGYDYSQPAPPPMMGPGMTQAPDEAMVIAMLVFGLIAALSDSNGMAGLSGSIRISGGGGQFQFPFPPMQPGAPMAFAPQGGINPYAFNPETPGAGNRGKDGGLYGFLPGDTSGGSSGYQGPAPGSGASPANGRSFLQALPLPQGSWTVQNNGHFWDIRGGGARPHHGLDLRAPAGTPVYAIADGVITRKKYNAGGYHWYFVIKHDARSPTTGKQYTSLYGHIGPLDGIREGQRVRAGQQIATISSHGVSFTHVHFEIGMDNGSWKGSPLNPNAFANFHRPGAHGTRYAGRSEPAYGTGLV